LDLDCSHDGVAAEEHGTEEGLFGLKVVRRHPGAGRPLVAPADVIDRLGHV
jgi:hypothetical protein